MGAQPNIFLAGITPLGSPNCQWPDYVNDANGFTQNFISTQGRAVPQPSNACGGTQAYISVGGPPGNDGRLWPGMAACAYMTFNNDNTGSDYNGMVTAFYGLGTNSMSMNPGWAYGSGSIVDELDIVSYL